MGSVPPPGVTASSICGPVPSLTVVAGDRLCGNLSDQCVALGLRLVERPLGAPGAAILAGAAVEDAVRTGLASPFRGFVELGAEGVLGVGLRCFETARAGGMTLSLSTRTAYGLNTLDLISEAIRGTLGFPPGEAADLMDICLGEALSNAVMHGNLQVPPHLRVDAEGFALFRQAMHERLEDPILSGRRVEINAMRRGDDFITVTVSDQGVGFDLTGHLGHRVDSGAKSGRGLGLISRLCASLLTEDGGRTLVMTFMTK